MILLIIFYAVLSLHTHNTVILFVGDSTCPSITTINGNHLGVCLNEANTIIYIYLLCDIVITYFIVLLLYF